jgi:hypothetical protein
MKFPQTIRQVALLLAAWVLLLGIPAAASASTSPGSSGTGWIRLAHLSPQLPPMDVYLYSFGNSGTRIVLHHVAYGTVSPYKTVAAGDYSVAMRAAGAPPASQPVLSGGVTVRAGRAYTAAAVGVRPDLRLEIMRDALATPAGKALVRVIQASLKQSVVTVSWDRKVIASQLPFASLTPYRPVSPGTESVSAGAGEANLRVSFAAGTVHTLVVLDGTDGLEIANLEDAAGSAHAPAGGAATGFGGTAAHGPGSPVPWLVVIGAGSLLALAGGLEMRQSRLRRLRQLGSGT